MIIRKEFRFSQLEESTDFHFIPVKKLFETTFSVSNTLNILRVIKVLLRGIVSLRERLRFSRNELNNFSLCTFTS